MKKLVRLNKWMHCLLVVIALTTILSSPTCMANDEEEEEEDWEEYSDDDYDNHGNNDNDSNVNDNDDEEMSFGPECGIYYAESTIPGAGYGLFAGRNYRVHDWVIPGDLVVPLVEMGWNNGHSNDYVHLWEDYQWSARTFDGMDREGESTSGASFGIGALPNCFAPFINVEETYTELDWAGIHRSKDPGAGAFTPYHNRKAYAYDDIEAGMEIFVDYGASYFPSRENIFGPIPVLEDYHYGDALLHNLHHLLDTVERVERVVEYSNEEQICRADAYCVPDLEQWRYDLESDFLELGHSLGEVWKSRPLLTLPENATHVDYLLEYGTQYMYYNRSVRSLEWLEENGQCADNIKPGNSTIPQAGRGGFATRHIAAGALVAPVPLIHVVNRSIYNMYDTIVDNNWHHHSVVRNESAIIGYQLILNYCFGHRDSTLLLCPYGIGAGLINHSKERANAKMVWSTKGSRHPEWLDQRMEDWESADHSGLAFDLIALRDIEKDEEILIDYGDEWQEAWERHVRNWKPPPRSDEYQPSTVLNEMTDSVVRTIKEGSYNPESDKILYCREIFRDFAGATDDSEYDFQTCRALKRYQTADGETRYVVQTYAEIEDKWHCYEDNHFVIFDFPRDGFNFRDAMYAFDHSQPWAFRHDMRIPEELMPEKWKNLAQTA